MRRERGCDHAEGGWVALRSWEDFEAFPWCSSCGQIDRLIPGEAHSVDGPVGVLCCGSCGLPLVAVE